MKKILFLLFFIPSYLFSQFPSFAGYTIVPVSTVNFKYENCFLNAACNNNKEKIKAEVPPWIIPGGWRSYFMVDGNNTYVWSTPKSLTDNSEINFKNEAVGPYTVSTPTTAQTSAAVDNWKRNYHNVYSAQYVNHPSLGPISIGIMHGENKNVSNVCGAMAGTFQNTINTFTTINCNDHNTWSGGNPYIEGWLGYHAMVSVTWLPNTQATNWGQQYFTNQLGPVSWPSNGYIAPDNRIATTGHSHPSSILANGYMYIYYSDSGPYADHIPTDEGRASGIKILRVLQSEITDPGKYQVYYKDPSGNESWLKSLPDGFTKETMLNFVRVQGPKSTDVLNNDASSQVIRFSVAKVRGTNYYLGLEEYIDRNDPCVGTARKYRLALRFSSDLINWTPRAMYVTVPKCWEDHNMRYPIFLDKTGWTNTEVDIEDFYILGTGGINKSVNKIRVHNLSGRGTNSEPSNIDALPKVLRHASPVWINKNSNKEYQMISVFPNPAGSQISLQLHSSRLQHAAISVVDITGKVVLQVGKSLIQAGNSTRTIHIQDISPGIYFIKIDFGSQTLMSKFVKTIN